MMRHVIIRRGFQQDQIRLRLRVIVQSYRSLRRYEPAFLWLSVEKSNQPNHHTAVQRSDGRRHVMNSSIDQFHAGAGRKNPKFAETMIFLSAETMKRGSVHWRNLPTHFGIFNPTFAATC